MLFVEVAGHLQVNGKEYCHTNGEMGIVVEYTEKNKMFTKMIQQAHSYMRIMEHFDIEEHKVKFWTQDLFMQNLTDMLKREEKYLTYPKDDFVYETPEEFGMWMAAEANSTVEP